METKTRILMTFVLLGLFSVGFADISYSQESGEIYFHGDVQAWSDKGHNIVLRGEDVTLSGWSGAYQDWGGVFETPNSEFAITIFDPSGKEFFNDVIYGDKQGRIALKIKIPYDAKLGKYPIKTQINHDDYGTFGIDHRVLYVSTLDSKKQESESLKVWSDSDSFSFGDSAKINWSFCPQLNSKKLHAFADYETAIVEEGNFLVITKSKSPSGTIVTDTWIIYTECGEEYQSGFFANDAGVWKSQIIIKWFDGDVITEITSKEIESNVEEPLFAGGQITEVSLDVPDLQEAHLLDWSSDGNVILVRYVTEINGQWKQFLGLMDIDGRLIQALDISLHNESVYDAKFSPDGRFVFVSTGKSFYRYGLESKETLSIGEGDKVLYFDFYPLDVASTYSVVVSVENHSIRTGTTNVDYSLIDIGRGDSLVEKISDGEVMAHNFVSPNFDFSHDGKRILFTKILGMEGEWVSGRSIAYIDTNGTEYLLNINPSCGSGPVWAPSDELVVYEVAGCSKGPIGGILLIATADGTFSEMLVPHTNVDTEFFVLSPDGNYIMYPTSGAGNFLKMKFSKQIPEFDSGLLLITTVPMIGIVLFSRYKKIGKNM